MGAASIVNVLQHGPNQANFQFWLTDALGTVRDVVDDTGAVVQSYEFNEHGIPMVGSPTNTSGVFSPKTYQGGLSVNDDRNDSGLYLMGHRHYAPELGRFISRDPIGFAGGLNLFNGAGTNPVAMVDPSGLNTKILTGTGYGWGCDYHAVPEPEPSRIPNAELVSRGSSKDFVAALETSTVFIYEGHHFGGGDILLSDGHFYIKDLLKQAKKLPNIVIFDACNTGSILPARGEYPNTVFVGVNDFIDLSPALDWAVQLSDEVQGPDPIQTLRSNKPGDVPPITVVGSPPYKGI